jgi:hypothetical protein
MIVDLVVFDLGRSNSLCLQRVENDHIEIMCPQKIIELITRAHRFNYDLGKLFKIYKIVWDVLFLVCKIAPENNFAVLISGGDKGCFPFLDN